jgi:hypothetical protein
MLYGFNVSWEVKPMVDRQDAITVVCGKCGAKFQQQIGWLQEHHLVMCTAPGCGAVLETDLNKLDVFLLDEAENDLAYLRLDEVER